MGTGSTAAPSMGPPHFPGPEVFPASFAQERFWFLSQLNSRGVAVAHYRANSTEQSQ